MSRVFLHCIRSFHIDLMDCAALNKNELCMFTWDIDLICKPEKNIIF